MKLRKLSFRIKVFIACLSLFLVGPVFADEATLTNINILPIQSGTTEIVLSFNEAVAHSAFTLNNPNRLVLDFPGTALHFGDKNLDLSETPIKDYRHGIQNGIDLRLVFDLQQPVQFNTTTSTANGFQLILTLNTPSAITNTAATTPLTSAATPQSNTTSTSGLATNSTASTVAPQSTLTSPSTTTSQPVTSTVSTTTSQSASSAETLAASQTAITPTQQTNTAPQSSAAIAQVKNQITAVNSQLVNNDMHTDEQSGIVVWPSKSKHVFTVVIDAGHGGKDPGTTGPDGAHEKNITLAIADDLERIVNKQPGMHAVMTRDGDYYVGLRQRLMIARKDKGDIFVAIHADAYKDPYATGASVFALSLHGASSEAALWLAQKENYSELSGIDLNGIQDQDAQVRSVLIDLSQTATIGASLQLGNDAIKQLGRMTPLHHGYVEQAPFMVLKSPDIPSILVETGFLSNPKEEAKLCNRVYEQEVATALMTGIKQYYTQDVPRNLSISALN
jgi:N-acetylmuramoyl-L-alanine amidase